MANARHLVFIGPPGTGKGTQAARLRARFGWAQLSSGDVLRQEIAAESAVGVQAREYVESGTLVPDDVITDVMLSAIGRMPAGDGFVLDGFPRTVPQAEALELGLAARGLGIDAAFDFRLADQSIIERIGSRRICKDCGATYNVRFNPPKVAGVCDQCGGRNIVQRADDREDVIATRLATYREQTAPLIDYYQDRGVLVEVDAALSMEEVERVLVARISQLEGSR